MLFSADPSGPHSFTCPSRPHDTIRPSCVNDTLSTPPACAVIVLIMFPSAMFQNLIVPSWLADASNCESPRKHASVTPSLCPAQLYTSRPVLASHTHSPPARSPDARYFPSGLYAIACTQSVCFLIACATAPSAVL